MVISQTGHYATLGKVVLYVVCLYVFGCLFCCCSFSWITSSETKHC